MVITDPVGKNNSEVKEMIARGERLPRPPCTQLDCPPKLYETMTHCWRGEPDDRPTFSRLAAFFSDYYTRVEQNGEDADDTCDEDDQ